MSSGSSVVERAKTKYFRFAVVDTFLNNAKFLLHKSLFFFFGIFKISQNCLKISMVSFPKKFLWRFCHISKNFLFRGKRKNIFVLTLVVLVYSLDRVLFERECVILCVFSVLDWRFSASHTAGTLQLGYWLDGRQAGRHKPRLLPFRESSSSSHQNCWN